MNIGNFLFSINAMYPYNLLPFSAVSTYFGGWRYNRLSSSYFRRTRTLEHWCPPSNVDWVATIYSSESYRDLSLCISWSNKLYTRKLLLSILPKTIFNVSSPFWSYLLTILNKNYAIDHLVNNNKIRSWFTTSWETWQRWLWVVNIWVDAHWLPARFDQARLLVAHERG